MTKFFATVRFQLWQEFDGNQRLFTLCKSLQFDERILGVKANKFSRIFPLLGRNICVSIVNQAFIDKIIMLAFADKGVVL